MRIIFQTHVPSFYKVSHCFVTLGYLLIFDDPYMKHHLVCVFAVNPSDCIVYLDYHQNHLVNIEQIFQAIISPSVLFFQYKSSQSSGNLLFSSAICPVRRLHINGRPLIVLYFFLLEAPLPVSLDHYYASDHWIWILFFLQIILKKLNYFLL